MRSSWPSSASRATPSWPRAIREYETRAARYWPLDVREVREEPADPASADLVREREGERLLDAIPPARAGRRMRVTGRAMTSEQFAAMAAGAARARARRGDS